MLTCVSSTSNRPAPPPVTVSTRVSSGSATPFARPATSRYPLPTRRQCTNHGCDTTQYNNDMIHVRARLLSNTPPPHQLRLSCLRQQDKRRENVTNARATANGLLDGWNGRARIRNNGRHCLAIASWSLTCSHFFFLSSAASDAWTSALPCEVNKTRTLHTAVLAYLVTVVLFLGCIDGWPLGVQIFWFHAVIISDLHSVVCQQS
jgi:hypothetical protein